ncbi:MAG: HisA/HisF-related TIM barrel protein [Anaerolineales bacterium]
MTFQVIPAIDLMGGRIVRLVQGRRDQATEYSETPAEAALRFKAAGASWLHVVNLDGAFDRADQANRDALRDITGSGVSVQFGGGLRNLESMRAAVKIGIQRLVLGTVALADQAILSKALASFGRDHVAVAIDLRGGMLQSHGWTEDVELQLDQYLDRLQLQGVEWVIYTDADRDGTGRGLAVSSAQQIQAETGFRTIVSGGVGKLDDIRAAREAGLAGVIVGKALHDGVFTLEEAMSC